MNINSEVEIILIEDDPGDAEMTIRALKKSNLGNNLVHLNDGEEALEFMFATGKFAGRDVFNHPKVILLDLKMPKINGLEVLEKLKSDERTRKIPVVMLTSSKEDPDILACYDLGVNSYIVKPVGFDRFIEAVSGLGMYWLLMNETHK
jgi:two-component system, response regulator